MDVKLYQPVITNGVTRIYTLGWEPSVSFEEGIAATIGWYREHEAWWRPIKDQTAIVTWDKQ